jgi:TetR/AcrR family transcriptional repressor of nem operon
MMTKGDQTRQAILERAAQVFSVRGYAGASMDDLTRATGLTKGGIYHHFGSKEVLALEAFDFAVDLVKARLSEMLVGKSDPIEQLLAYVNLFYCLIDDPVVKGGCPILNAAVEVDDTNPVLCERVQQRLNGWRLFVLNIVEQGRQQGAIRAGIEPEKVVTVMIASLEGAIMMSKLYADRQYLDQVVEHLTAYITSLASV